MFQIARDLEAIYKEGRLSDFTIVASGRELPAHQIILSARSPVFAAMLEPHTEEAKNSRVIFPDIDFEVHSFFTSSLFAMHLFIVPVCSTRWTVK